MVNSTLFATIYVNPVQGNDTNIGSRSSPFKSLTRALKATKTAVIIQLTSGTYSVANGEVFPIVISGGVTVIGNEANKGAGIVISGSGEYETPSFGRQSMTLLLQGNASLLGVTVTNPVPKGTGIWIESAATNVANNTFVNCGREGIFVTGNAKPAIVDNVFRQNSASGLMMARHSKGEVLRNVFQKNSLGIAISDYAAPLIANNTISDNRSAIALSRNARPVLRHNRITKNTQGGMLVNGDAIPDLGNNQDAAGNIFLNNNLYDLHNNTPQPLVSAGNQLNPTQVKGRVDFIAVLEDHPRSISGSSSIFSDLAGHWTADFVEALVQRGAISGFPDGTFAPDSPINRAQYAAIIAKIFKLQIRNAGSKFTDVNSSFWAASAISQTAEMGFISGFPDRTFRPGQNLTKVQAIVSIVNGLKLTGGNPQVLNVYRDRTQIPSYATNAVAIATQSLLVVNYPQTEQLEPLRDITRGEVATLIYQALVAKGEEKAIASPYIVSPDVNIPGFTDISGHWAEPFIRGLASMNLTHGFADGSYQPDKPMTRAEYAALVAVAFNPAPKRPPFDFTDISPDFWADEALQIASRGGFISGFNDRTFRPAENVQRIQVILSLVNGLTLPTADNNALLTYTDSQTIPNYARQAVVTATQQRIVVNYPNPKQLVPTREATRAEVAAMVYQALVAIQRASRINSTYIV
ncbi:S-layer homology domain-containing protein [Nodularia spumigena]|uniref:S-layer homology domain-containing protein n=1 Tax=Nodularia spumigena TaxID=70799 RepID=UPI00232D3E38|nr:S-layer homology domain-containing protein [Nodularia spumigena]MDB9355304.1 S-layer homology domain-containing protein [Nodularia spumigena CS-587/03]MDB9318191.1 S-layer homology domain-containing protein [Nodularia spumigena CS-590/01A]MDB9324228.1 S-layer homology domain-containing protein [Nodularia spumigena CS-591/07A]MDB9325164.1 S-layer homology domain-containing protein [Nodularia spumigena CS-590/02]MDB9332221.1 S-layer homology domain-containing protein [Nodularia spumigena CS-5